MLLCFVIQISKWRQITQCRKYHPERAQSVQTDQDREHTQGHTNCHLIFHSSLSSPILPSWQSHLLPHHLMLHILDQKPGPHAEKSHGRFAGKDEGWKKKVGVCVRALRNTVFLVSAIWKLKVDKQWRELHPISFLKPEQAHSGHNAQSSTITDPVQHAKYCQGLGLINRWPDTEKKCEANKEKGS